MLDLNSLIDLKSLYLDILTLRKDLDDIEDKLTAISAPINVLCDTIKRAIEGETKEVTFARLEAEALAKLELEADDHETT
jgi:hypothetical protein